MTPSPQGIEEQIRTSIKKTQELAERCRGSESSDNYESLEEQVDELEERATEAVHSKTDLKSLLSKLRSRTPLMPSDLKALELLIVGDAESYLKYESELEEWKAQLKRVLDQIAAIQGSEFDVESLMHMRALCREAHEVLADLVFYFDAKERAEKFKIATQGQLDAEGYGFLAEIVQSQPNSDKF
jgi:chromosome segregation ATPase